MLCNTITKWDFVPELYPQNENIDIVDEMKTVGYIMRSDMRTCSNTEYLVRKAFKRMWIIGRLAALGASISRLVDVLQKQVLSVLWLGAPAWFCQLTKYEKHDIDRVAKVGLRIIFGEAYLGFDRTLSQAQILRPSVQLARMTHKFAVKSSKHEKFSQWFQPAPARHINTRSSKNMPRYANIPARTARYRKSPNPYMTELLNTKH